MSRLHCCVRLVNKFKKKMRFNFSLDFQDPVTPIMQGIVDLHNQYYVLPDYDFNNCSLRL